MILSLLVVLSNPIGRVVRRVGAEMSGPTGTISVKTIAVRLFGQSK